MLRLDKTNKLKVVDKIYHVSTSILSNQSLFFEALFKNNFTHENEEKVYELENCDQRAFALIFQRFYGFTVLYKDVHKTSEMIPKLADLANRFQFNAMLAEIEQFLLTLPKQEIKKYFGLADRCCFEKLRKKILSVMNIQEFEELKNQTVVYSSETIRDMRERSLELLDFGSSENEMGAREMLLFFGMWSVLLGTLGFFMFYR